MIMILLLFSVWCTGFSVFLSQMPIPKGTDNISWTGTCTAEGWVDVFAFLLRFFLMYLINKDETEHTGQVRVWNS